MDHPAPTGNRRGRDTRARILAAARACFTERGIDLTLDEVARAAATTRMTVHRHTGGRGPLITHLVLRESTRLADGVGAILDGEEPFPARLTDALVATVSMIRATPHLVGLFTRGDATGTWPTLDPDDRVLEAIHGFFRPYLVEAADAGLLRAGVDETLDWLLRQVLVLLVVPASAPDDDAVRHQVATFVLPAVLRSP